ncbi:unnamed protein product [Musa banksii]
MVSTAGVDDEETQVLDLDSAAPGEVPVLYGETQALDGSDGSDGEGDRGIDERGETQLLDEDEETAAVDSGGEGTDRTEVLSDDEGVSNDDATHYGDREDGGNVDSRPELRVIGGEKLCLAEDKKDNLVDSGALTDGGDGDDDDDRNAGSKMRSFSVVPAAAMCSSGLAAAQYLVSRRLENVFRPFNNGMHSEMENCAVDEQIDLAGIGVNNWKNRGNDISSLSNTVDKLDLDHEMAGIQRSNQNYCIDDTKSRCCNMRVKRLFKEFLPSENHKSTSKDDSTLSKVDSSHLLTTDYALAGLSYIDSQEPSDLSQANALEIVDKFLSISDVGSSQEIIKVETDILKSPLVFATKGVQLLAEKTDCRSPVGKPGIFDWNDSIEDEGGGELFSKRKDSFFERSCGARKTRSHPPKSRLAISGTTRDAVDKSGELGDNLKIYDKGTVLVNSDSRLMIPNPVISERFRISEANIRKNLFKDAKGESKIESLEHQLDATEVEGSLDGIHNVVPDTQLAAEALEALVHESLVNAEKEETRDTFTGNLTSNSDKSPIMKTASSKNVSPPKWTSVNDSQVVMTRSKKRKMLSTELRGSLNLPRVWSSSRMKNSLEDTTAKRQAKREKAKLDGQADMSFISGHDSSMSTKKTKTQAKDDRHLDEKQKQHHNILVERHPARCARYSKSTKLLKQNEALPHGGKDPNESVNKNALRSVESPDNHVTDKGCPSAGLDLATEVKYRATHAKFLNGAPLGEELQTFSLTKDGCHCPKRRRTSRVNSGNLNDNLNKASAMSDAGASETIGRSSEQVGKRKIFIRSVTDILNKVKRKKRSIFTYASLETDREPSSTTLVRIIRGMQSSLRSPLLEPLSNEDTKESARKHLLCPVTPRNASTLSAEKAEQPKLCSKYVEDAAANNRLYRSLKAKGQPNDLACTTPSRDKNAVSPIYTARYPPRSCNKSVSASSVASMLKDMRRRKDMSSVRVLFSNHLAEDTIKHQKKILARLGLPTASSISDATHFVTDEFVRTQNMLEAIAMGKPVVTPMWLESCGQASCFMDEKYYILRDSKKERKIGFNMPVSLARACQQPLLQGKRVFVTANVKPNRELIASLVKASHGQAIKRIGRSALKQGKAPDELLVISCEEDYSICMPLLEKGTGIFSSELLLNGIVIQKLEYERHRLFSDHIKQTRSTIRMRLYGGNQFLPVTKCA